MYASTVPATIDQSVVLGNVYFHSLDDHLRGIVLTPTCDFEQRKAELVTICAAINAWELVTDLIVTDWSKQGLANDQGQLIARSALSAGKRKWLSDQLQRLMGQQFPRYHWLAPLADGEEPLIADFQIVACHILEEADGFDRLGILQSPYREQLPTRYSAYMGRIGTPDIQKTVRQAWIDAGIDRLFPAA